MKLTDEQVVRVLVEWMGWKCNVHSDTFAKHAYVSVTSEPGAYVYRKCLWRDHPLINSRDALAPVLAGLSPDEWARLHSCVMAKLPVNCKRSETFAALLTLPPADLARAIAEAISK